jgi:hypothetical protein
VCAMAVSARRDGDRARACRLGRTIAGMAEVYDFVSEYWQIEEKKTKALGWVTHRAGNRSGRGSLQ